MAVLISYSRLLNTTESSAAHVIDRPVRRLSPSAQQRNSIINQCLALRKDRPSAVASVRLHHYPRPLLRPAVQTRNLYKDMRQDLAITLLVESLNTVFKFGSVLAGQFTPPHCPT